MSYAQFGITEEPLCQCFGAWHRAIGSETQHGGTEILERILIDGVQHRDDVFPMNDYGHGLIGRSEAHTSELQSLMLSSYAVFCLTEKRKRSTTAKSRITETHKSKTQK